MVCLCGSVNENMCQADGLPEQFLQRDLVLYNVTVGVVLEAVGGDQSQKDGFLGLCLGSESVEACGESLLFGE